LILEDLSVQRRKRKKKNDKQTTLSFLSFYLSGPGGGCAVANELKIAAFNDGSFIERNTQARIVHLVGDELTVGSKVFPCSNHR